MSDTEIYPSDVRDLAGRIEEHFAASFGIHQTIAMRHRLENLIEAWLDENNAPEFDEVSA